MGLFKNPSDLLARFAILHAWPRDLVLSAVFAHRKSDNRLLDLHDLDGAVRHLHSNRHLSLCLGEILLFWLRPFSILHKKKRVFFSFLFVGFIVFFFGYSLSALTPSRGPPAAGTSGRSYPPSRRSGRSSRTPQRSRRRDRS